MGRSFGARAMIALCGVSFAACGGEIGGTSMGDRDAGTGHVVDGEVPGIPGADGGTTTPDPDGCRSAPEITPLFGAPPADERPLHWTADDGALVTRGAGRVRGRHENEAEFSLFHALYFENRTFEFLIEDTIPAGGSTIRVTWLPDVQNRNPNFRVFWTGTGNVFHHNVDMTERALGDGHYAYEYEITRNHRTGAPLAIGDLVELEFGVFLATSIEGRTNYYTDTYRYVVGTAGLVPFTEAGDDVRSGGDATIPAIVAEPELSFSQYALNLPHEWLTKALDGRRRFHTDMISGNHTEGLGPTLPALVGLAGPRVNETSCTGCHVRDGRGSPPAAGDVALGGAVLRLASASDASLPHETLGGQLQDRALEGTPEAGFAVDWQIETGAYADGTPFELMRPVWSVVMEGTSAPRISARLAPPIVGLGLLEAIDDASILALSDPADCNADGISGRANVVVDPTDGMTRLGRFGWRASKSSLVHQTAAALANDMGVTSSAYSSPDCGAGQSGCDGGTSELADEDLELIATYVRALGVPPRRGVSAPGVARGAELFAEAGCTSCHATSLETGITHPIIALRGQTIRPYTDLLLHDMGDALADEVEGEGVATGREWRTTPLWGLGLTQTVSGEVRLLHDGRARSIAEAILWHGGEAQVSRDAFASMSTSDRDALLAFLSTL